MSITGALLIPEVLRRLDEIEARLDAIEKSKAEARAALLRIAAKRKLNQTSKKRGNNAGSKKIIRRS